MLASDDIDLNALLDKNVDEIMEFIKKMVKSYLKTKVYMPEMVCKPFFYVYKH